MKPMAPVYLMLGLLLITAFAATGNDSPDLLPPMNGEPGDFAPRRAGLDVNASIKIAVTNAGLFCIRHTDLVAAGVDPAQIVGWKMRLFCRTQEVAVRVSRVSLWQANDYLLFYGWGFDGDISRTNIFWLGFKGGGRRIASRSGVPISSVPDVTSARHTIGHARDYWFQDTYLPSDPSFDHWFAEALRDSAAVTLTPAADYLDSTRSAECTLRLFGYSFTSAANPDHCTRFMVNGVHAADFYHDGQTAKTGTCVLAAGVLRSANTITLQQIRQPNVSVDQVFLQDLTITYWRRLVMAGRNLVFGGQATPANYRLGTLPSNGDCWVFDVTDPATPVQITGAQFVPTPGGFDLRFGDTNGARRYAVAYRPWCAPPRVERVFFRDLAVTSRQADYIVICPYQFRYQVYRLLKRRHGQNLRVVVAPLPDIYNEFGYGIADPAAIKQFIGYAFHHWQAPAPRYVLLVGNGSYDPFRNMVGTSAQDSYSAPDLVPVHMGPSRYKWTALDGWYVQVNGADKLPDLAIGRLPLATRDDVRRAVDKTFASENIIAADSRRRQALLVADRQDGGLNFKAACESLRTSILGPAGYTTTTAYNDDLGTAVERQVIRGAFNAGAMYACYFGHGAMDQWGVDNIFNTNDVVNLANSFYPVVAMLTCQAGNFQSPTDRKSMAEAFLEGDRRGAAACIASSALSMQGSCEYFAGGFFNGCAVTRAPRLGDAFLAGCTNLWAHNPTTQELLYMQIFGDPAMLINP